MAVQFFSTLLLIISSAIFSSTRAEDVFGCGGFVKTGSQLSPSLVKVVLYNDQGSLKYSTECGPNGHYMIPVYDKGNYILRVLPPDGWIFEPNQVPLNVDGKNDACSKNEDINFIFRGFQLFGQVVSQGSDVGPEGIQINLLKDSTKLSHTTTDAQGQYQFPSVSPGTYEIVAEHPHWQFKTSRITIDVTSNRLNAGKSLVLHGFRVTGGILSDNQPAEGIRMVLYGKEGTSVLGCKAAQGQGHWGHKLCSVVTTSNGQFVISSAPNGDYVLAPDFGSEELPLNMEPTQRSFVVTNKDVSLGTVFRITGFSVRGRVLSQKAGKPVANAEIFLDATRMATSDAEGRFILRGVQARTYRMEIFRDGFQFEAKPVALTTKTKQLDDIVPSRVQVCGTLPGKRKVRAVDDKGGEEHWSQTDTEGRFCLLLPQGSYTLTPEITDAEVREGLVMNPTERKFQLVDEPLSGLDFFRAKARLRFVTSCLDACLPVSVVMTAVGRRADPIKMTVTQQNHEFDSLIPGKYVLTIGEQTICWEKNRIDLDLGLEGQVQLTQKGFVLRVRSSHALLLHWVHATLTNVRGQYDLPGGEGDKEFCLPRAGVYSLTPVSCHHYRPEVISFDTAKASGAEPIVLRPSGHWLAVTVNTDLVNTTTDVSLSITSKEGTKKFGPLDPVQLHPVQFQLKHVVSAGDSVVVEPSSGVLLFEPDSIRLQVDDRHCEKNHATFTARKGVFIEGQVRPPIDAVEIVLESASGRLTTSTDSSGRYRVGPLRSSEGFRATASKLGFALTAQDGGFNFAAERLSEVSVFVRSTEGTPLESALLSLSSTENSRRNGHTDKDGLAVFRELTPGMYYLRPILKEYAFEPELIEVAVGQGEARNVEIIGKRTAFSVYGRLVSLSGEGIVGVTVEAVGCHQEEVKSGQDGQFRIRGLLPTCKYRVRVKDQPEVERSLPDSVEVDVSQGKDVDKVQLTVVFRSKQMEVAGHVLTAPEYLQSLKMQLFRTSYLDAPLQSLTLTSGIFFFSPVSLDNQTYLVRLESSLSRQLFKYSTQEVTFSADKPYKHLTFNFTPQRKAVDHETTPGSLLTLPLILLLTVAAYNHKKVIPLVFDGIDMLSSLLKRDPSSAAASSSSSSSSGGGATSGVAASSGSAGEEDSPTGSKKGKVKPKKA